MQDAEALNVTSKTIHPHQSGLYTDLDTNKPRRHLLIPSVDLKRARKFDNIFGRPITEFAHKADIIRLEALLEHGGIYVDLDVYNSVL